MFWISAKQVSNIDNFLGYAGVHDGMTREKQTMLHTMTVICERQIDDKLPNILESYFPSVLVKEITSYIPVTFEVDLHMRNNELKIKPKYMESYFLCNYNVDSKTFYNYRFDTCNPFNMRTLYTLHADLHLVSYCVKTMFGIENFMKKNSDGYYSDRIPDIINWFGDELYDTLHMFKLFHTLLIRKN